VASCGLDGSELLIEWRRKDIFRAVSKWEPAQSPSTFWGAYSSS